MMAWLTLVIVAFLVHVSQEETAFMYECPPGWEEHTENCYKFYRLPVLTRQEAMIACSDEGAQLLSVNTDEEHAFILTMLDQYDGSQQKERWWTSGRRKEKGSWDFYWEGDGSPVESALHWHNSSIPGDFTKDYIIYYFDNVVWAWILGTDKEICPYICEISKEDIFKISDRERGPDYGLPLVDEEIIPQAPKIVEQPQDTVFEVTSKEESVSLDCFADGYPVPGYQWYRVLVDKKEPITPSLKHTVINGKLMIHSPSQEDQDDGNYQCSAVNDYGSVLSNIVSLSFGYLQDFPKYQRAPVVATSYRHISIECNPPAHYPDVLVTWYKDDIFNFIRPELKPYTFISRSGRLYFSQVTMDDKGDYYCLVYKPGDAAMGKTSEPTELQIREGSPALFDPTIDSGFPAIYPPSPMVGDDVRVECWAYGASDPPLEYSWIRLGNQMPVQAYQDDHNRVLNIPDIKMYDAGTYRCKVQRFNGGETYKDITITLKAEPYFVVPLKDQFIDEGSELKWQCQAGGSPAPDYMWFKNSQRLSNETLPEDDQGRIIVSNNLLHFTHMDWTKDNGSYQCAAKNDYGIKYNTAELRVLGFPPTFAKYPLPINQFATVEGNTTLQCHPEAAPYPAYEDILWYKDGKVLEPGDEESGSRVIKVPNGNLFISPVKQSDTGTYNCTVSNKYGQASTQGNLTVLMTTTISYPPYDATVEVNRSAFLHCDASYNPTLDLAHVWYQGGRRIDFDLIFRLGENRYQMWYDPHFKRGQGIYFGGLYIMNAQYFHRGVYTCEVQSATGIVSAVADVDIIGPPYSPAGIYVDETTISATSALVNWKVGGDNGKPIKTFVMEGLNGYEGFWKILVTNIRVEPDETETYSYNMTNLRPFSQYQLRVRAENVLGTSEPSIPSDIFFTKAVKPDKYPDEVGGGGGKEGDLTLTWKPLPQWDWGAPGFGYRVFWKTLEEEDWTDKEDVMGGANSNLVVLVGQKNVYKLYQVSVQTFNDEGFGPRSPAVTIRSAMGMPAAIASNVQAQPYNDSACMVTWNPVKEDIKYLKGTLGGYRIRYWMECCETEQMSQRLTVSGQTDHGLVIGLLPDTSYFFDVLIFNDAGNGPKSEYYVQRTFKQAPIEAPVEVEVHRKSSSSIYVKWRGVSTTSKEEPLEGYMVRLWHDGEHIKHAQNYDSGRENEIYVKGLRSDVTYKLRVVAYSRGGEGTLSYPIHKFMLGAGSLLRFSWTVILWCLLLVCGSLS